MQTHRSKITALATAERPGRISFLNRLVARIVTVRWRIVACSQSKLFFVVSCRGTNFPARARIDRHRKLILVSAGSWCKMIRGPLLVKPFGKRLALTFSSDNRFYGICPGSRTLGFISSRSY